jgi:hypothetical protein
MKTFIESQFPVSKVSKESYKERKANYSQTLTGLGKWWGRQPLILVRATILGLLLPTTANPKKDSEIFLKILTMDEEGLWLRKSKSIALKDLYALLQPQEREKWFSEDSTPDKPKYKKGLKQEEIYLGGTEHNQRTLIYYFYGMMRTVFLPMSPIYPIAKINPYHFNLYELATIYRSKQRKPRIRLEQKPTSSPTNMA